MTSLTFTVADSTTMLRRNLKHQLRYQSLTLMLAGFPIVVVTAEASWMAADNHGMVDYLAQAGCNVEHLRLEDHGVHGNGHAMMFETNSDDVATVMERLMEDAKRRGFRHGLNLLRSPGVV